MRSITNHNSKLSISVFAAALALLMTAVVTAQEIEVDNEVSAEARPEKPGFRTDIGLQIALGGNGCLGGGTEYAECRGTEHAWDAGFGLTAGAIVRPWKRFSLGLDLYYGRMTYHQDTKNKWSDFALGPVGRLHFPFKMGKFTLEPSVGIQVGWVEGVYHQSKLEQKDVSYKHKHMGAFLGLPVGIDFFPFPRIGVGLEFRLIRTFYTEACFESKDATICRGTNDKALTDNYSTGVPGDKGEAKYPWKLFWGVHGLYYF